MQYIERADFTKKISRIAFGGAALSGQAGGYGFGEIGEKNAEALVHLALEAGITIFDTAPIYGFNTSEIRLGKYLKSKRDKCYLVSKAGITWHSTKRVNLSNEPKIVESMLYESLKNLQSEYIDIYMLHWPDPRVDIRYALEVLEHAKISGKIKHIGLCNTTSTDYELSKEVCKVEVLQSECNLFNNRLSDLDKFIQQDNLLTMGWGTLDKGILAGTVTADSSFASEDARSWAPWWKKSNWKEKTQAVKKFTHNFDVDPLDVAVNYALNHCHVALCGFKNEQQLHKLITYQKLDESIVQEIQAYVQSTC